MLISLYILIVVNCWKKYKAIYNETGVSLKQMVDMHRTMDFTLFSGKNDWFDNQIATAEPIYGCINTMAKLLTRICVP